jgi:O-antigen/teichoic acid export membrane protein
MGFRNNIIKNSLLLFCARVVNPAATIAIGLYIAKFLGVEAFGQFTFILSYFFLFSIIFSLGLATLIGRDTAKTPDQACEYFCNASFIVVLSSGVGLIIMFFLAHFFNLTQEGRDALYTITLSIFPSTLIFIWESLLITFEKNQYIMAIQGIEAVIKIALGYWVLSEGFGLIYLMTVFLVSRYLSGILYYLVIKKVLSPLKIGINFIFVKRLLTLLPPFVTLYVFSVLFSKIDLLMLALLTNFTDTGIYSAAYKLLEISFMLPTCIVSVFFPILSRYAKESPTRFIHASSNGIFYSLVVMLPIIIVSIYLADKIIFTVYSKDFFNSILSFRILIVCLGFYMIDQIFAHSLVACNFQNLSLRALVTATFMNIVLNLILIPRYSYLGASATTLLSMAALTLIHHHFVIKHIYRVNLLKMVIAPFFAILPAGAFLFLMQNLSLIILLFLFFSIYLSIIVFTNGFFVAYRKASPSHGNIV